MLAFRSKYSFFLQLLLSPAKWFVLELQYQCDFFCLIPILFFLNILAVCPSSIIVIHLGRFHKVARKKLFSISIYPFLEPILSLKKRHHRNKYLGLLILNLYSTSKYLYKNFFHIFCYNNHKVSNNKFTLEIISFVWHLFTTINNTYTSEIL